MSRFKVDTSGNLVRENGSFVRTSGAEEIRQGVQERVLLIRSEAKFAQSKGLPHFDGFNEPSIFEKGFDSVLIANMFQREIADVAGIVSVDVLNLTQDDAQRAARKAQISFSATADLDDLLTRTQIDDSVSISPL